MKKIALLCFALLFVGCGAPSCDDKESKKLVLESVEKSVKIRLASKLNPSIVGDEWRSILKPEEVEMVEFNYKEYGPVLEDIVEINQNDKAKTAECSAKLRFRNAQAFALFYRLQKDSNGKLYADVEWR
jgi:hypothetical protein